MRIKAHKQILLVILSAAFYAASFLSCYGWFLIFFSFILLFQCFFSSYKEAALLGFFWGFIAFGIFLSAPIDLIAQWGSSWIGLASLCYWAFFSSLWFCAARLGGWLFATTVFFSFIVQGIWWPLIGEWRGYGVACPLVSLVTAGQLLGMLPFLGWEAMRFFFFMLELGIAQRRAMLGFLGVLPFCIGFLVPQKKVPQYEAITFVTQQFVEQTPYERAQELCHAFITAQEKNPKAELIIFPESAFPYPLNEHSYAVAMWQGHCNNEKTKMLLGSHFREKGKLFNTAFLLNKRRIILFYVKSKLLPFFEEPRNFNPLLGSLHTEFLQGTIAFSAGSYDEVFFFIDKQGPCTIRICSELFWDIPYKSTVFLLVHDGYFRFSYYPRLLKQFAAFQALRTSTILFYSGWVEAGIVG